MRISLAPTFALLIGCADLTVPVREDPTAQTVALASPASSGKAEAEPQPRPEPKPAEERVRVDNEEKVGAAHILVSYQGARRAKEDIKRSKEEAMKRAKEVQAKAVKGEDFAALAKQYSDGPSAPKGGDLGSFKREAMVKPFADAAFALDVGKVSEVVETPFGFHVIKRTQ